MTVTPELLEDLVDDAGLFPPEQLPMDAAVARHRADSAAGHLMLTDRFLCPASRIGELRAVLDAGPIGPDPLRVGLIIDTGLEGVPAALAELAAFVHACWVRTVPFKATAGLHRAVRAVDERDGLVHHGFLNLLVAAAFAARGETEGGLAAVVAETDSGRLAAWAHEVSPGNAKLARSLLVAYGSCSTSEPREEAGALGLLAGSGS